MEPAPGRPATASSVQLVQVGAPIALRDGSRVHIRQLRDSDRQLLLRGFRRLTPESRYRRFLAPTPTLSEGTVRYLVEIDHRNHEASRTSPRSTMADGSRLRPVSASTGS